MRVHLVAAIGDRRRTLTVLMALVAAAVVTTAARPRARQRRHPARPGARAGRRDGRQAERRGPARAARAAQPRLQPRATGSRRALRPADRRRRPALPGRPRAGRRRHRRPEDQQGRQPHRAPPAAVLVRAPHRLAHEEVDAAQARDHEPAGDEDRAAPRPTTTEGTSAGWLVVIALAAAVAAFCVAIAASVLRRPGRRPARRPERRAARRTSSTSRATAPRRAWRTSAGRRSRPASRASPGEAHRGRRGTSSTTRASPRRCGSARKRCSARRRAWQPGEPVIGYVTVSSEANRNEADGAVHEIEAACERAQWELAEVVTDRESGRGLERPGLAYALSQIAEGKARGLVVSDLRRLSRSIVDLGALMEWFRDAGAGLVALDLGVDTSTPGGHEVAATLITLGDWERERIARRTRSRPRRGPRQRPPDRPSGGQRPARPGRAHHRDARRQHDAAGHRRPAQRRGRPHPARRSHVAALERPGGPRLPPPRHPHPARPVPHSGRQGLDECAKTLRNGALM